MPQPRASAQPGRAYMHKKETPSAVMADGGFSFVLSTLGGRREELSKLSKNWPVPQLGGQESRQTVSPADSEEVFGTTAVLFNIPL